MSVRWFRWVALAEAISYLLLLAATVAKRAFDLPGLVPIMGPIHGVLFLVYFVMVLAVREELGWRALKTLLVIVAGAIPLGGFIVERRELGASQAPARS